MEREYHVKSLLVGKFKDGIYRRHADSKKHKMKLYDAYGIDEHIIRDLKERNCTEVRIKELDTNKILSSTFSDWLQHGIVADHDSVQRFLPLKYHVIR
jgi:hypothetical protein